MGLALLLQQEVFGQATMTKDLIFIKGRVLNSKTQKGVSFANVGFFRKEVGTVTDDQGYFELQFAPNIIANEDVLQVSILGFQSLRIPVQELNLYDTKNMPLLYLTPISYQLDQIVLDGKKKRNITIGNPKPSPARFGYWKNEQGLGGEIATRIKISKPQTKLENLHFPVLANMSDSLLVRVNVYDIHPSYFEPKDNILKQPIYHTITRRNGKETIPLSEYNILVDDDVIVSIELVQYYGKRIGFAVGASANKKSSYLRGSSQGYWQKFKSQAMAFTMDVTYPSNNAQEVTRRVRPEEIVIYWDTSRPALHPFALSENRDIEKELALLSKYLTTFKNIDITLHLFAYGVHQTKIFKIRNASADPVIAFLETVCYEGATDYSALKEIRSQRSKYNLLFTDGHALFSPLRPIFDHTTFTISSSAYPNKDALEEVSLYTDGVYLDLQQLSVKDAVSLLIKDLEIEEQPATPTAVIEGVVLTPLDNANGIRITNTRSSITTTTDAKGRFNITASIGDRLRFNFPGLSSKTHVITASDTLHVKMVASGDWLDEVVLSGKKKKELIETSIGKRNKDAIGSKLDLITAADIKDQYTSLDDVLDNEPQIQILKHPITGETLYVIPRTLNMSINTPTLPIVVIDGVIYEQNPLQIESWSPTGRPRTANDVPKIDVQTIQSIVVTSSLSATTLYGSIAAGGAIVIKTNMASASSGEALSTPVSALISGNDYLERVQYIDDNQTLSPYQMRLEQATTLAQIEKIYRYYTINEKIETPSFFMDVAKALLPYDRQRALSVLSNLAAIDSSSRNNHLLLAYTLESFGELTMATQVYAYLLKRFPNDIQSYRDLALAYQNDGVFDKAFEIYKQMLSNTTAGLDFTPLKKTIENEVMHLLAFHKSEVAFDLLPVALLDTSFKKDRRLVFEWTRPETNFEIQFVNPQGKYFTWPHDSAQDVTRLQNEFIHGYNMEEFALDDAPPGEWLINIQCFDQAPEQPVYLRYTVFLNYATTKEQKITKVIKLHKHTDKVTLGKITLY